MASDPYIPYRERTPTRACRSCGAYLSSANEDPYCWLHGGWSTQRLSAQEALGTLAYRPGRRSFRLIGEALDNLISEAP